VALRKDRAEKLQRLRYSLASTGLRRGLSDLASILLAYHPERDHSFDRRFGTDTAGSVPPAQLGIADPAVRAKAVLYLPSPPRVTRWMLDHIGIAHRGFTFVDLGCGKGRVLLVASEYPFARIVGVEISTELSAIAGRNVALYQPPSRRCKEIEVLNADAAWFDFPETDLLVHLYHPFEPELTTAVLAYLVHTGAVEAVKDAFAQFPWLEQTRYEQSLAGHYNWIFYSN
jgi:SAM-dependent methyltransferase